MSSNEAAHSERVRTLVFTELQTIVMTKRSDPRFGETVYRLTNIQRTEPPASLFELPSDYTVNDMSIMNEKMNRVRKLADEGK